MGHIVASVTLNSPAHRAGVTVGDELTGIDGEAVIDIFDYQLKTASTRPVLNFMRHGNPIDIRVRKNSEDAMGIGFVGNLLGNIRTCKNHCLFCFAEQLPHKVRPSLRVKDDDWRHSVLFGNYVTLTNLTEWEFARILDLGVSPLYISVHATDPMTRARMLRRKDDTLRSQLARLCERGIAFHAQVVLCPGLNDGAVLAKTIIELSEMHPCARSLAVVPVGLSDHREGLPHLDPVDRTTAAATVGLIELAQKTCLARLGTRFVFASDELYCLAGRVIPESEAYEEYEQIGNGVGMLARMEQELFQAASNDPPSLRNAARPILPKRVAIATGLSAAPYLRTWLNLLPLPLLEATVLAVENRFFGASVTVAGLLVGPDIARAVRASGIAFDEIFIPREALHATDEVFLDDSTPEELSSAIGIPVRIVECGGEALWQALLSTQEE